MEYLSIKNLKLTDYAIGYGSYSVVSELEYNNKKYAFKEYVFPSKIFKKNFEGKMDYLKSIGLKKSSIPEFFIKDIDRFVGYLSDRLFKGDIHSLNDRKKVYESLKKIKESILELHENNIIHGDIHNGNILYSKSNPCLIDFDNCRIINSKDYYSDIKKYSIPAKEFIKRRGIIKNLDIYMFNVMTFAELNRGLYKNSDIGKQFSNVKNGIFEKDYGVFDNKYAREICDQICFYSADEFLIDLIDEADIEKNNGYYSYK